MSALRHVLVLGLLGFLSGLIKGEEFDFEIPEEPEARMEVHGNLDGKWGFLQRQSRSPFSEIRFFDAEERGDKLSQYQLDFYLNGTYQQKQVGFFVQSFLSYTHDEPISPTLFQLYGSVNFSPRLTMGLGKRRYTWGKGYAFNPVGFVNAEKDPENPDLALSGKASAYFVYNRSFSSKWLRNFSISGVVLPPTPETDERYADVSRTGGGLKLYVLIRDVDVDLMVFGQKGEPQQYGADFSSNLRPNFEVHGEFAYARNETKSFVQNDRIVSLTINELSYLLGLRYLAPSNTTIILDYYHAPYGLTKTEFDALGDYLQWRLESGLPRDIQEGRLVLSQQFRSRTLMRDYLYIKATQPEPFGWLYTSISCFAIVNLQDKSFNLSPQFVYKPYTNFEFLIWPTLFVGNENTEYGNKPFAKKVEVWGRFYF